MKTLDFQIFWGENSGKKPSRENIQDFPPLLYLQTKKNIHFGTALSSNQLHESFPNYSLCFDTNLIYASCSNPLYFFPICKMGMMIFYFHFIGISLSSSECTYCMPQQNTSNFKASQLQCLKVLDD